MVRELHDMVVFFEAILRHCYIALEIGASGLLIAL